MIKLKFSGIIQTLILAIFFLLQGQFAYAASYQWSKTANGERITITDPGLESVSSKIAREDKQDVSVTFDYFPPGLIKKSPPFSNSNIIDEVLFYGTSLVIHTKTPEFGFVVTQKDNQAIIIDFFPDPLGRRWQPKEKDKANKLDSSSSSGANSQLASNSTSVSPPTAASQNATVSGSVNATVLGNANATLTNSNLDTSTNATSKANSTTANSTSLNNEPLASSKSSQELEGASSTSKNSTNSSISPSTKAPDSTINSTKSTEQILPSEVKQENIATFQDDKPALASQPSQPKNILGKPFVKNATIARLSEAIPDDDFSTPMDIIPGTTYSPNNIVASKNATSGSKKNVENANKPRTQAKNNTQEGSMHNATASKPSAVSSVNATTSKPSASTADNKSKTIDNNAAPVTTPSTTASVTTSNTADNKPSNAAPVAAATSPDKLNNTSNSTETNKPKAQQANLSSNSNSKVISANSYDDLPLGKAISLGGGVYRGRIEDPTKSSDKPKQDLSASAPNANQDTEQVKPKALEEDSSKSTNDLQADNSNKNATSIQPEDSTADAYGAQSVLDKPIELDENGNPITEANSPDVLLQEIAMKLQEGKFEEAFNLSDKLLEYTDLTKEQRGQALHFKSSALYGMHKNDLLPYFQQIVDATIQAINFDPESPNNAAAYLRLGFINLEMDNADIANAYFNRLKNQFPKSPFVALTYYYWGDYYFQKGEYQKAADEFQTVLEKYPNSQYVKDASLGLAKTYYQLGYYKESKELIDFIYSKWNSFYVSYPPFLNMAGDVSFRLNDFTKALQYYWLYVNLEPAGDEADVVLTRIGDIYTIERQNKAAKVVYEKSVRDFPDKDGGLVAKMRLAERAITDAPSIGIMESIFDNTEKLNPQDVYKEIIEQHPDSLLAPLAELKLAMWYLWNKDYTKTLDICENFNTKYPNNELLPNIKELALKTFNTMALESDDTLKYTQLQAVWEHYPILQNQQEILGPASRINLAIGFWKDGKPNEALATIDPFFLGSKVPEYSEMALLLALNIYLENDQWNAIRVVANKVATWELTTNSKQQLDYSLALAAENLGENNIATPIWENLYNDGNLDETKMAYTIFFLANNAKLNNDLLKAYNLGLEAYSRFKKLEQEDPESKSNQAKTLSILSLLFDIAESTGRLDSALKFGKEYLESLPTDAQERASVLYRIAGVYNKQGDVDSWKKELTTLIKEYPNSTYAKAATAALTSKSIEQKASQFSPTGQI